MQAHEFKLSYAPRSVKERRHTPAFISTGALIMLWVISCKDKPNTAAIREKFLKPHREHLQNSKGILVLAGATQNDEGTEAIGSMFVVNVNSRAEAKKFSDGDAFTQNGVFESITITRMRKGQWNPGAADGA